MIVGVFLAVIFVIVLTFAIWRVLKWRKGNKSQLQLDEFVKSDTAPGSPTASEVAIVSPGTPQTVTATDENDEYCQIIEILKQCDADRWNEILDNFKREKVTDKAMEYLECDPKDDGQECWKDVMPQLGVRVMFKTLWSERVQRTTTIGMTLDEAEEGPTSPTLQSVASDEGVQTPTAGDTAGGTRAAFSVGDI